MNRPNPLMENPIKEDRIVNDTTFAIRLKKFYR